MIAKLKTLNLKFRIHFRRPLGFQCLLRHGSFRDAMTRKNVYYCTRDAAQYNRHWCPLCDGVLADRGLLS